MNYEGSAPRPSFTIRKWPEPVKLGRPRKDEIRKRVRELKKTMSWAALTRKLNQETGENRSQSAYRGYLRPAGSHKRK
jgi:hypothetical protein